jgi:hypothetical protein
MVTKSTKSSSASQKNFHKRSFYRLAELVGATVLNKEKYTLDDLLDFAAAGQLTLSFPVSNRYIVSGDYEGKEEIFESPHPDEVWSGLLPLSADAVWKLICDGKATIEYLFRNDYEFKKLLPDSDNAFPVIESSQLMVAVKDWELFTGGLPPVPMYPEKPEDPKIIGTLVYLYARATKSPSYFKKDNQTVIVDAVVQQIVGLVTDKYGEEMKGMAANTVREKINHALETMQPKILELQKS